MSFNIPSPSIVDVFKNSHPFFVPKYQRGYAWEASELTDFIKDILALHSASVEKTHFVGGLVHVHATAANSVSRQHEIVDGQQRMATFTLAMLAILKGLNEISEAAEEDNDIKNACSAWSDDIRESFFYYKEMQGSRRVEMPKLVLSRADEQFFRDLICNGDVEPSRESHRRLQNALTLLSKGLVKPIIDSDAQLRDKQESLIGLYRTISERCIVIHIVSQSRQEAYRLFSVLNDRGRTLSDGDLLRAKTLELLEYDTAEQGNVERLWDGILDVTADETDKYLKAYYPSTIGKRAPSKNLFDAYQEEFLNDKLPQASKDLVFGLAADKPTFFAIRQGEWPFPSGRDSIATAWDRDRLHRLVNILRHEAAHPLLLSAAKLGERSFIEVVNLVERFVFRYITIVGAHPGPLYVPYNEEAKEMRLKLSNYNTESLRRRLVDLQTTRANDATFQSNLLAKLEFSDNNARNREIRHFLTTLESYRTWYERGARGRLEPDKLVMYDVANTTLEHIYPQNAAAIDSDHALESWKNSIGNLTILSSTENSRIGNGNFASKKVAYSESGIGLTRQLAQSATWTVAELTTRQQRIAEMALGIFDMSK